MVVPRVNGGGVGGWREIVLFLAKLAIIINSLNFMCVVVAHVAIHEIRFIVIAFNKHAPPPTPPQDRYDYVVWYEIHRSSRKIDLHEMATD